MPPSPPPPTFGSQDFLTGLQEIRTISDTRTAEQRTLALQWNYGTGTFTPPGYWDQVTANYIEAYGLDERAAAHAFALTTAAMMDAFIGCFEAKYVYWFIRPPQADPGLSRMYAGIHYRFDIDAGQALGNNVGRLAVSIDRSSGLLAALQ